MVDRARRCLPAVMLVTGAVLAFPSTARARRVVYLNFESTELVNDNGQNPTTNSFSSAGFTPGLISGWLLSDEQKAQLLFYLKEGTVPLDVVYTLERPAQGEYDMVVFGSEANKNALFPDSSCSGAIGLADCVDGNLENISFVFYGCLSEAQQADMRRITFHTLTALGFGWGLENVTANGEVMGGYSVFGLEYGDSCVPINGGGQCEHVDCAEGQQNSTADLLDRIGPRVDDGPPSLVVLEPADGAIVQPNFDIAAQVDDMFGGLTVTLELEEAGVVDEDLEPPYAWSLSNVPAGPWTLRVRVVDADGNEAIEERQVCVETCDPAATSGGGSTSAGESGDDSDSSAGDTSTSGGGDSTGSGSGNDSTGGAVTAGAVTFNPSGSALGPAGDGCHCSMNGSTGRSGAWWMALLGLGWARARRRRRATRC